MNRVSSRICRLAFCIVAAVTGVFVEHGCNLDGNAWIPALERGWLFFEMSVPHLLQALIEEWRATAQ